MTNQWIIECKLTCSYVLFKLDFKKLITNYLYKRNNETIVSKFYRLSINEIYIVNWKENTYLERWCRNVREDRSLRARIAVRNLFAHPDFFPPNFDLKRGILACTSIVHAWRSFPRIPQWLLCASLGYFHFSSLGHVIRYCHSPQNVHTRSFPRSHVARTVHARGGQDMRVCGWKCRTAVHPVGRVGWALENGCIRTSLTRIGCSSCRSTSECNYLPLALNVVR